MGLTRLIMADKNISEFEDIAIDIIQNETHRGKKKRLKKNTALVNCGMTSNGLVYV